MENDIPKRKNRPGAGRPKTRPETIQIGCRIERTLYDAIKAKYGEKVNMTEYINNVLRRELEL